MARVLEFILRMRVDNTNKWSPLVRVWAKAENLLDLKERDAKVLEVEHALRVTVPLMADPDQKYLVDLAEAVAKLPFCSAVEVTDSGASTHGLHGVLIYPTGPK